MDIKGEIDRIVRASWPSLRTIFREHAEVPGVQEHAEINALLLRVGTREPTCHEQRLFRRLVGDPHRSFGDLRLEDSRCQLSLIESAGGDGEPSEIGKYEVVSHSWEGIRDFCQAAAERNATDGAKCS